MSKVKFDYNLSKDAWSWVLVVKDKTTWGLDLRSQSPHVPDELFKIIQSNSFKKAQIEVEKFLKRNPKTPYKNKVLFFELHALKKAWKLREKAYFKILEDITQKPILCDIFTCYFTSGFMCPYNEKENWFMASMWHSAAFSITTICHEIIHLHFLSHYRGYLLKKGLNNEQIENLKESLTFLLNESEFNSVILCNDNGYPAHRKLREQLKQIWSKDRNFQNLIDKAIQLI